MSGEPMSARATFVVELLKGVGVPTAIAFFVLVVLAQDVRSVVDELRATRMEVAAMADDLRGCLSLPPRERGLRRERLERPSSAWRHLGLRSDIRCDPG